FQKDGNEQGENEGNKYRSYKSKNKQQAGIHHFLGPFHCHFHLFLTHVLCSHLLLRRIHDLLYQVRINNSKHNHSEYGSNKPANDTNQNTCAEALSIADESSQLLVAVILYSIHQE